MNEQEKYDWMVYVSCMTYNHAPYIVDAMNGFTMQETNFPFVCAVVDDASTDGEQEVIKSYLNEHFDLEDKNVVRHEETDDYILTFARHKTNLNCYFAVLFLKYNHYSIQKPKVPYIAQWREKAKYIALCEGDDYWIHSRKLQEQVNVLQSHQDCSIAYCKVIMVTRDKKKMSNTIPYMNHIKEGIVTLADFCREEFYCGRWCFHTSSFLYRKEYQNSSLERDDFYNRFPYGDMPAQLWCLLNAKGYYINLEGSCYRVLSGGYNSYVKTHPKFAVSQEHKLIKALEYLDNLTSRRYHRDILTRIKRAEIKIMRIEGKHIYIYKPRYWNIVKRISFRGHLVIILSAVSPALYIFLRKHLGNLKEKE